MQLFPGESHQVVINDSSPIWVYLHALIKFVFQGNFSAAWEELGEENELSDAFSLPMKSLEEAVKNITLYLGLQVSLPDPEPGPILQILRVFVTFWFALEKCNI